MKGHQSFQFILEGTWVCLSDFIKLCCDRSLELRWRQVVCQSLVFGLELFTMDLLCLSVRSGAVWTISEAGGDHAGRADDCSRRAAAAGHCTGLPVLEGPVGSRRCPVNTLPQLRVRECVVQLLMFLFLVFCFYFQGHFSDICQLWHVIYFSEKLQGQENEGAWQYSDKVSWCQLTAESFVGSYWSQWPHPTEPFSSCQYASGVLCLRSSAPLWLLLQDKPPLQVQKQINRD